jgi:hypothetical protein
MIRKLSLLIFTVFASLPNSGVAQAQTASALVLEQSGASTPEVKPYSEIPAGMTVSLKSGAKLVFLHYNTCRQVAVVGGTIKFGEKEYAITGGKKESDTRTPCPRPVALKSGGEMTGVMLRSAFNNVMVKFSERPAFVLIGKRADDFASLRIVQAEKTVLEAPLEDRHFNWPKDAAPLAVASSYEMVLIPKTAGTPQAKLRFFVEKPAEASAEGVVLINAE